MIYIKYNFFIYQSSLGQMRSVSRCPGLGSWIRPTTQRGGEGRGGRERGGEGRKREGRGGEEERERGIIGVTQCSIWVGPL
jgi:hypothetical protein